MQLNEAIKSGFLDYTECEFHDPNSAKPLTLLEAYDRGLNKKIINYMFSHHQFCYNSHVEIVTNLQIKIVSTNYLN